MSVGRSGEQPITDPGASRRNERGNIQVEMESQQELREHGSEGSLGSLQTSGRIKLQYRGNVRVSCIGLS
jgi:hypothetical protein